MRPLKRPVLRVLRMAIDESRDRLESTMYRTLAPEISIEDRYGFKVHSGPAAKPLD
jgi:hypothetical protein